jgi:hypothetical protein
LPDSTDTVISNWNESGADEDKPSAVESAVAVTKSTPVDDGNASADDHGNMYMSFS